MASTTRLLLAFTESPSAQFTDITSPSTGAVMMPSVMYSPTLSSSFLAVFTSARAEETALASWLTVAL